MKFRTTNIGPKWHVEDPWCFVSQDGGEFNTNEHEGTFWVDGNIYNLNSELVT